MASVVFTGGNVGGVTQVETLRQLLPACYVSLSRRPAQQSATINTSRDLDAGEITTVNDYAASAYLDVEIIPG